MKQLLIAALVALFALSFTMAQEQAAKQEKTTTVATTSTKSTTSTATNCSAGPKGCCAASKGSANMKDCPMMKGSTGASMSKADTTTTKAVESK